MFFKAFLPLVALVTATYATIEVSTPKTTKQLVESEISFWSGTNPRVETAIKNAIRDPESYSHIETTYTLPDNEEPNIATYSVKFRAKNAFGGYVITLAKAEVNIRTKEILSLSFYPA